MKDRKELQQKSPGPGTAGLQGMAKGSPLQEIFKKDIKWDKARSCEYCSIQLSS